MHVICVDRCSSFCCKLFVKLSASLVSVCLSLLLRLLVFQKCALRVRTQNNKLMQTTFLHSSIAWTISKALGPTNIWLFDEICLLTSFLLCCLISARNENWKGNSIFSSPVHVHSARYPVVGTRLCSWMCKCCKTASSLLQFGSAETFQKFELLHSLVVSMAPSMKVSPTCWEAETNLPSHGLVMTVLLPLMLKFAFFLSLCILRTFFWSLRGRWPHF